MITINDYATREPSAQGQAFAEWVITQAGMTFKTKAAQEAFERGLYMGRMGYPLFQAENREAKAAAKPARKPRARKAA